MMNASISNPRMNRRRFLQIVAAGAGSGAALAASGMFRSGEREQRVSETQILMGTVVNMTAIGLDAASGRAALKESLGRMIELESILSRFKPHSQISELNRAGSIEHPHPGLLELIEQAQRLSEISGGAFDITVKPLIDLFERHRAESGGLPSERKAKDVLKLVDYRRIVVAEDRISFAEEGMKITLDGIAKGYVVDAGVAVLRERGFESALIEAGGDLVASGCKEHNQPWKVGIRSPRQEGPAVVHALAAQNCAVATSGDYEEAYSADFVSHHIIDPRLGLSPRELASATVSAPTGALADGLSTALMVLGHSRGRAVLEAFPQTKAYLVTKGLEVIVL